MKIKGSDYDKLDQAIRAVIEEHGDLSPMYQAQGLTFTRFAFDVFYKSGFRVGDGVGIDGDINVPDCNDDHIGTAVTRSLVAQGIKRW